MMKESLTIVVLQGTQDLTQFLHREHKLMDYKQNLIGILVCIKLGLLEIILDEPTFKGQEYTENPDLLSFKKDGEEEEERFNNLYMKTKPWC